MNEDDDDGDDGELHETLHVRVQYNQSVTSGRGREGRGKHSWEDTVDGAERGERKRNRK